MLTKKIDVKDFVYFSKLDNSEKMSKFASANAVETSVMEEAVKAQANKKFKRNIVFVGLAVTSWEAYGPNDNGDAFPEEPMEGLISADQTLLANYKTFEDGAAYKFHQSDDTANAIGKVHFAYYNAKQHRIELVVEIFWDKAATECLQIKRGKALNLSMGTGVQYDICSHCGNQARIEAEHCDHIKYQLLDIVDGVPIYMINAKPKFNDISIVIIPGDQNAKVMHTMDGGGEEA